jgi:hypothetical protein
LALFFFFLTRNNSGIQSKKNANPRFLRQEGEKK